MLLQKQFLLSLINTHCDNLQYFNKVFIYLLVCVCSITKNIHVTTNICSTHYECISTVLIKEIQT